MVDNTSNPGAGWLAMYDKVARAVKEEDNEYAHQAEDELRTGVLNYILIYASEGNAAYVRELAALALSTSEFRFKRWYA